MPLRELKKDLKNAALLIVDDQQANIDLLESFLADEGYTHVTSTTDPRRALPLFSALCPDLILLDLHLPDRHGSEVLDELRSDPETAAIPIVVVSADATVGEIQRLRDRGADDYVPKPLDVAQFLASLERVLPATRSVG